MNGTSDNSGDSQNSGKGNGNISRKKILLVCRTAPYGNSLARESLETALAAGALGAQVSMLFLDEGVWQLVDQQRSEAIDAKNHGDMLAALPLYDVDHLLVDQDCLDKRGIAPTKLDELAQLIDAKGVKEILAGHDVILSF